jgi:hypothetical protein
MSFSKDKFLEYDRDNDKWYFVSKKINPVNQCYIIAEFSLDGYKILGNMKKENLPEKAQQVLNNFALIV